MKPITKQCLVCDFNYFSANKKQICTNPSCQRIYYSLLKKTKLFEIVHLAYERGISGFLMNKNNSLINLITHKLLVEINKNRYIISDKGIILYNYITEIQNERKQTS